MANRHKKRMMAKQKQKQTQNRMKSSDDDGLLRILRPTRTLSSSWTAITESYTIKDAFKLHTLLTIGAAVQITLCVGVRQPWCYLPAMTLLVSCLATTAYQVMAPIFNGSHPFLAGTVLGRSTAIVKQKAGGGVVVFHFGARFNHPLGLLAPGGEDMTTLFQATMDALERDRVRGSGSYGLLGANLFRGGERASNATLFLVLYFRDVDGLQRFAHSPIHEQAYLWLDSHRQRYPHLSAFHETFCVPAGCFESLYINTAPILLGNTFTKTDGDDGDEDEWVNALVDADDARLQTMKARMEYQAMF